VEGSNDEREANKGLLFAISQAADECTKKIARHEGFVATGRANRSRFLVHSGHRVWNIRACTRMRSPQLVVKIPEGRCNSMGTNPFDVKGDALSRWAREGGFMFRLKHLHRTFASRMSSV